MKKLFTKAELELPDISRHCPVGVERLGSTRSTAGESWDPSRLVFPSPRYRPEFSGTAIECGREVDLTYWKGIGPEQLILVSGVAQAPATCFLNVLDSLLQRGSAVALGLPEVQTDCPNYKPPFKGPWDKQVVRPIALAAQFANFSESVVVGYSYGGIAALIHAATFPSLVRAVVLVDLLPDVEERSYRAFCRLGDAEIADSRNQAREKLGLHTLVDRVISSDEVDRGVFLGHGPVLCNVNRFARQAVNPASLKKVWEYVPRLAPGLPVLVLRSGRGSYVTDEAVANFSRRLAHCRVTVATIESARGHSRVFSEGAAESQSVLNAFIDSI